jgi:hypothetical protein
MVPVNRCVSEARMASITAKFDGRVFVPAEPIELPEGTQVEVVLPQRTRRPTPDQDRECREILDDLAASQPAYSTVEEAIQATRRRQ